MYNLIADSERAKILIKKIADFALFIAEFDDVRIGVGCNSGRHRSVVIVNEVSKLLSKSNIDCQIVHREFENIDNILN
jgi:RNase adaptor protein for sRNA GlmZ degradation